MARLPSRAAIILLASFLPVLPAARAQTFWQNVTSAAITDDISAVAFGNSIFAAVTARGNVLTSPDGLAWSTGPAQPGTKLNSVVYGPQGWIAVGAGGTILTSPDLRT